MSDIIGRIPNELTDDRASSGRVYYDKNIVVFKPSFFISNIEGCFSDYHFSIPLTDPPPTKIGKREYAMKANRALVVNPEQSILISTDYTENIPTKEYPAFFISKKFLQEIAYEMSGKTDISFSNSNIVPSNKIRFLIEQFIDEFSNTRAGSPIMIDSISTQITISLLRELKSNISDKIHQKPYHDNKKHVSKVIDFIQEYYNSAIKLDDLCQIANLSKYHFIRVFKEEIGKTPYEYLIDIKIEKAIEMLKTKQYSLNEISQMCGFVNQSHFCSVFKRKTGICASDYRNNCVNIKKTK